MMASWGEYIPGVNYGVNPYEIAYKHGELFAQYLDDEINTLQEVINQLQFFALEIESNNKLSRYN